MRRATATGGYFDESSMLRRVHRERVVALSGPRALLMQAAHPLAVFGLLAHSSALDEPYERLARTAETMNTIAFGSREEADRITRRVRAMHRRVRGHLPERVGRYPAGTPYRADDPELLLWVLFTLVDSALVVYSRYVRSLSDDERAAFWEDYKVVGRLFGLAAEDMPDTLDELDSYRARMLAGEELLVTEWARAAPRPPAARDRQLRDNRAAPRCDPRAIRLLGAAAGTAAQGIGRGRRGLCQACGHPVPAGSREARTERTRRLARRVARRQILEHLAAHTGPSLSGLADASTAGAPQPHAF
jgi:hypothetical protein